MNLQEPKAIPKTSFFDTKNSILPYEIINFDVFCVSQKTRFVVFWFSICRPPAWATAKFLILVDFEENRFVADLSFSWGRFLYKSLVYFHENAKCENGSGPIGLLY